MAMLFLKSWLLLLYFELPIHSHDFEKLRRLVQREDVKAGHNPTFHSIETLCRAIDLACVFYFRRVLCLQRSAATTLLLRQYGHKAEMVIGAQILPFKTHAWTEVKSEIVNDKPYLLDMYQVLERY